MWPHKLDAHALQGFYAHCSPNQTSTAVIAKMVNHTAQNFSAGVTVSLRTSGSRCVSSRQAVCLSRTDNDRSL